MSEKQHSGHCDYCGREAVTDEARALAPIRNDRFECCGRLTCLAKLQAGELRAVEAQPEGEA